jgi:hypothetical protein
MAELVWKQTFSQKLQKEYKNHLNTYYLDGSVF